MDARVDAGEERDAAVEATLTELGDPDRLADGYAGPPGLPDRAGAVHALAPAELTLLSTRAAARGRASWWSSRCSTARRSAR